MKALIHFMCVFAVMSATISPACAFISGKHGQWIEICSGIDVTKVQIADDELPDITSQGCEFCFQHFHFSGIETSVSELNIKNDPVLIGDFINETALIQFHQSYHSRAPPIFS